MICFALLPYHCWIIGSRWLRISCGSHRPLGACVSGLVLGWNHIYFHLLSLVVAEVGLGLAILPSWLLSPAWFPSMLHSLFHFLSTTLSNTFTVAFGSLPFSFSLSLAAWELTSMITSCILIFVFCSYLCTTSLITTSVLKSVMSAVVSRRPIVVDDSVHPVPPLCWFCHPSPFASSCGTIWPSSHSLYLFA